MSQPFGSIYVMDLLLHISGVEYLELQSGVRNSDGEVGAGQYINHFRRKYQSLTCGKS